MLALPKPATKRCVIDDGLPKHAVNRRLAPRAIPPVALRGVPLYKMEFRSRRENAMGVDISSIPNRYTEDCP